MDFDAVLRGFMQLHTQYGGALNIWLLIFARVLGFTFLAPILNRKDIPFPIKLGFVLFITTTLIWVLPTPPQDINPSMGIFVLLLGMNILVGVIIGFIADMILKTISAAGSVMNSQIGLSSAMVFDPSSKTQVMVLDRLFAFIAVIVFTHMGGIYWLIQALQRSFEVFPMASTYQDIVGTIDIDYLITVSGNTIMIAVLMVAPVIVVTMSVDIILGVVNRTAQQMPVFQLSFALKPTIGVAVMLATFPIFMKVLMDFLHDFSSIF